MSGRPPRVLFVSSHSQPGGSENVLADLLDAMPSATAAGVVALQAGPLVDRLRTRSLPVTVVETTGSPAGLARGAVRLAVRLRCARPDLVHANGVKAALVSAVAARLAAPRRPVPVVWMKHDVSLDGVLGRALARRCGAVAGVSREVLDGLGDAGRQLVVHPGVRIDAVDAAAAGRFRSELDVPGPVVTVIGRLDPAKGHGELLEVLPDVLSGAPSATALLVGPDDPQHPGVRAQLSARAAELGVTGRVRLLGHRPSATVIGASDVVCVPTMPRPDGSGREGFGLVAAEALVLGVPVVGYDVGATGEVLGGCGALVPGGDRAGLAREIRGLLADPATRAAVGARGRERASGMTVERTAQQLLDLYTEVAR
ncbi:glycosyltransferase family 4 protein [Blastococcus saxobsidens]|uniref:Glycosyltransferase family 4 protein n=1 Tax=Blastococcus saxobsidens TaxID=138336 RepID=A0A6L9VXB2_9ACTN|nr:glycosyltransferase family 4 protein [Blastococcus saxobsidens]